MWAVVLAILFAPVHQRISSAFRDKRGVAGIATVVLIVIIVIIPLTVLITSLVTEASGVYEKIQSGEVNFGNYLERIFDSMPGWASDLLNRLGLTRPSRGQGEIFLGHIRSKQNRGSPGTSYRPEHF